MIETYLRRHQMWSLRTFGEGQRTAGIVKHIEKELTEILAKPHDLIEWIDVIILALDGYWRHGGQCDGIMHYLQAKQNVNFARTWPAPADGEPTEHDRTGEAYGTLSERFYLRGQFNRPPLYFTQTWPPPNDEDD